MRGRNTTIKEEPSRLFQFFTDPITGAHLVLDEAPSVEVFDVDPKKVQSAVPVQAFIATQVTGVGGPAPGAYYIDVTLPAPGWYFDKWTLVIGGKVYSHTSSWYVADMVPITFSNDPLAASPFYASLLTQRAFLDSIMYLQFKVTPKTLPNPELRVVSRNAVMIDWTGDNYVDQKGNLLWLVNFTDPKLEEGIYTVEIRSDYGSEKLISSPMLLTIEKQNDYPREVPEEAP